MISDEVFKCVTDAIKVMKKLDAGMSIHSGSEDHQVLTTAVLQLVHDHLIDHSPLTPRQIAFGPVRTKADVINLIKDTLDM